MISTINFIATAIGYAVMLLATYLCLYTFVIWWKGKYDDIEPREYTNYYVFKETYNPDAIKEYQEKNQNMN